jgi:RNA polymerase sigma-70 factor (ECF subfamily)
MFRRRNLPPCLSPPDRLAAGAAGSGDDAFADLYARFAHRIRSYALQRLHDPDLADDITSTVFTRALASLPNFKIAEPGGVLAPGFEGWLLAIARNAIIDHVRANRRLTILDTATWRERLVDHAQDPATAAVAPDEREHLLGALQQLNETQRQIVLLRLQGWNGVEIAELLGMSHGAVRIAQYRAYQRLRALLTVASVPSPAVIPEHDHA